MNYAYTLFGNYNTKEDWGLVLVSQSVDFPRVSASLDELPLYGQATDQKDISYERRQMRFEYVLFDAKQYPGVINQITSAIHGKKMEIVRSIEPDYTYIGRCSVDPYRSNRGSGRIVINVDAEPYKLGAYITETVSDTEEAEIAVPSSFLTPVIVTVTPVQDMSSLTLYGLARDKITWIEEDIIIRNLTGDTPVILNGETELFTMDGDNKYPDMDIWNSPTLVPGSNVIGASSQYCTIEMRYRPRLV